MLATPLEVLDISIVALPAAPFPLPSNLRAVFEGETLRELIQGPLAYNQTLQIDPVTGAANLMNQAESMRSQKIVAVSPLRIELHDRSGEVNVERLRRLPEIMSAILTAFGFNQLRAIGANYEMTYRVAEAEGSAAGAIARRVLPTPTDVVPESLQLAGAVTRLFLSDNEGRTYTVAVEPRFQDRATRDLFLSCNVELPIAHVPPVETIRAMFDTGYGVFQDIVSRLFSNPAQSPS